MRNILVISMTAIAVISWSGNYFREKLDDKIGTMADQRAERLNRLEALQMGRAYPDTPHKKKPDLEGFHVDRGSY